MKNYVVVVIDDGVADGVLDYTTAYAVSASDDESLFSNVAEVIRRHLGYDCELIMDIAETVVNNYIWDEGYGKWWLKELK